MDGVKGVWMGEKRRERAAVVGGINRPKGGECTWAATGAPRGGLSPTAKPCSRDHDRVPTARDCTRKTDASIFHSLIFSFAHTGALSIARESLVTSLPQMTGTITPTFT